MGERIENSRKGGLLGTRISLVQLRSKQFPLQNSWDTKEWEVLHTYKWKWNWKQENWLKIYLLLNPATIPHQCSWGKTVGFHSRERNRGHWILGTAQGKGLILNTGRWIPHSERQVPSSIPPLTLQSNFDMNYWVPIPHWFCNATVT